MTEHPLTDDICLAIDDNPSVAYSCFDWKGSMRTAADWQLEQVIEWLKDNLNESYVWAEVMAPGVDVKSVILDLKQSMRPTKTQENN